MKYSFPFLKSLFTSKTTGFAIISLCILLITGCRSCFVIDNPYAVIAPGTWRGVLLLSNENMTPNSKGEVLEGKENIKFEEVVTDELPFLFDITYTDDTTFYVEIINGTERIRVDDISVLHDRATNKDTLFMRFTEYDNYIKAVFKENIMEGYWYVPSKGSYSIPFRAKNGESHRFSTIHKPVAADYSGKWEATFGLDEPEPYKAIGEFVQKGDTLYGTFLTETGDYRYLEGNVLGNKLYLSCFDGSHAFLFTAKEMPDKTLSGGFKSGNHYTTTWEAKRNPDFQLRDPTSLTTINKGFSNKMSFKFPNSKGKIISLDDPAYQQKVKIIQIMGTWCPNCRDETVFLKSYLEKNKSLGVEVLALSFERYQESAKALGVIQRYQDKLKVPYEILWAGSSDKEASSKALPMLNQIMSYPTTLILDKKNNIRKIITGFNGPATSLYEEDIKKFDTFVKSLLAE